MIESVAPHTRAALSATVSITGWRSVGELEMTRRISAVAVCCSRASVSSRFRASSSVNRRTFSMAITAWSAKVFEQRNLFVREGLHLIPPNVDGANGHTFAQERRGQHRPGRGAPACREAFHRLGEFRLGQRQEVLDVDRLPIAHHAPTEARGLAAMVPPIGTVEGVGPWAATSRRDSPSRRKIAALAAPQNRAALSATTSMTGWRSVGELEMTRRISAVAVCCSSASVSSRFRASSSLNRRTFSMAITAWSANVSRSAICFAEKGWGSGPRAMKITPGGVPSRSSGVTSIVRTAVWDCPARAAVTGISSRHVLDVLDVERPAVEHSPSNHGVGDPPERSADRQ